MRTHIFEAQQGPRGPNWGKFMVGEFDAAEWAVRSAVDDDEQPPYRRSSMALLTRIGWSRRDLLVLDLQTCEGAVFTPGGLASADVEKHGIWHCPLYMPFLAWLYQQDLSDIGKLPRVVLLPDAPFALATAREQGAGE